MRFWLALCCLTAASAAALPEPPRQLRPAWWRDEGIVVAGSWEALPFRIRLGGPDSYEEKAEGWRREQSEETLQRLKALGFNLIITSLYKGFGLEAEREGIEDAIKFSEACHRLGLRVGFYIFSGTIFYESLLAEEPGARDWLIRDHQGNPIPYNPRQYFRPWVNRSHPGVREHMRKLVRIAIEQGKADVLHFDNYGAAPGYEPYSVRQFRQFLAARYTAEERRRRFGFPGVEFVQPPPPPYDGKPGPWVAITHALDRYNADPLYRDFVEYRCETEADTYRELAEYARSLKPDVVVELNPAGYYGPPNARAIPVAATDHERLLGWGGAFWNESHPGAPEDGVVSRFRSHKLGRQFGNMVFHYTSGRVDMADSLANNLQSIGCPAWFHDGRIVPTSGGDFDPAVLAMIKFFRREQRYFRDAEDVADVGVLNTFANRAFGSSAARDRVLACEQALYQSRVPFTLVPGRYPGDLRRFRVVLLPDTALISDALLTALREYLQSGGGLVMTGEAGCFDEDGRRRRPCGLAGLFPPGDGVRQVRVGEGRAVYLPEVRLPHVVRLGMMPENRDALLAALRWAAGGPLQAEIKAPDTVGMALYRQAGGRRLLHLVNYGDPQPAEGVQVTLKVPAHVRSAVLLTPESRDDLPFRQQGDTVRFTVPRLGVYALIVLE
ncbi:MAG TPA: beta-galactosidase trimerization domain-containing protein [Bryobacteraceae bacterium]|nr:beta-galactosidase trimerization domain-containing protein [Bryobacteraceae bacterium]